VVASAVAAGGLVGFAISFRNLPDVRTIRSYIPSETSYIYDVDGKPLASLHGEANREVVPLNQISPDLKRAVLAIEDSHFFSHSGIQPISIVRALAANVRQGETVEGASTLTMQLVKNLFLTPDRTLSRKLAEAVLALRLEQVLTKAEILELYLNQVYWGHNNYGVETAAQNYFGRSAADLTLGQAAMMAGFIQSPESWSPFTCRSFCVLEESRYQQAFQRQEVVLQRLVALKWITPDEAQKVRQERQQSEIFFSGEINSFQASRSPYVTQAVAQVLSQQFGQEALLKGGFRVQTTIDWKLQQLAAKTVKAGHQSLQEQGLQADQMALVAIDPRTHFVKAMVGGIDYQTSQYNRVLQAHRQPGSAFKPFVYYAAFASGRYEPDSTDEAIADTPVSYPDGNRLYTPKNYDNRFLGQISLRRSLELSRNIPAIKLGQAVGLNEVVAIVQLLGIKSPIEPVTSLPLGAVDLTPLELVGAYATLASNGWHSDPEFILQITNSYGEVLVKNVPRLRLVLNPWAAAAVTDNLQGVIGQGTGVAARLDRPAAGKTGTTSSERDIWFVGYVPQLAVGIWVGNDDYRPLGYRATGGGFVAPIWKQFMVQALKGVPVEPFPTVEQFLRPDVTEDH